MHSAGPTIFRWTSSTSDVTSVALPSDFTYDAALTAKLTNSLVNNNPSQIDVPFYVNISPAWDGSKFMGSKFDLFNFVRTPDVAKGYLASYFAGFSDTSYGGSPPQTYPGVVFYHQASNGIYTESYFPLPLVDSKQLTIDPDQALSWYLYGGQGTGTARFWGVAVQTKETVTIPGSFFGENYTKAFYACMTQAVRDGIVNGTIVIDMNYFNY